MRIDTEIRRTADLLEEIAEIHKYYGFRDSQQRNRFSIVIGEALEIEERARRLNFHLEGILEKLRAWKQQCNVAGRPVQPLS